MAFWIPLAMMAGGAGLEALSKSKQEKERKKDIAFNAEAIRLSPWLNQDFRRPTTQVTGDPLKGAISGGTSGLILNQGLNPAAPPNTGAQRLKGVPSTWTPGFTPNETSVAPPGVDPALFAYWKKRGETDEDAALLTQAGG